MNETPNPLEAISEQDRSDIQDALFALGESRNKKKDGRMVPNEDPQATGEAFLKLEEIKQRLGMGNDAFVALCRELEKSAKARQDDIDQKIYDKAPDAPGEAEAETARYVRDRLGVALNIIGRGPAGKPLNA